MCALLYADYLLYVVESWEDLHTLLLPLGFFIGNLK